VLYKNCSSIIGLAQLSSAVIAVKLLPLLLFFCCCYCCLYSIRHLVDLTSPLFNRRTGNGNVAIDCARILTKRPDELAVTDISTHALTALRDSGVEEVVVLGRRGHAQASFTYVRTFTCCISTV
jgi:hypothetical protein